MKRFLYIPLVAVALLAFSCASMGKSLVEPGEKYKQLVVGKLVFVVDYLGATRYGISFEGERTRDLTIYVFNVGTQELHKVYTYGDKGLFYAGNLPPGDYFIAAVEFNTMSSSARGIFRRNQEQLGLFTVEPGKVNNVGSLRFEPAPHVEKYNPSDPNDNRYVWKFILSHEMEYDAVKALYAQEYKDSAWNDFEWNEVSFGPYN